MANNVTVVKRILQNNKSVYDINILKITHEKYILVCEVNKKSFWKIKHPKMY